jgi:lipoate-protein ligase B
LLILLEHPPVITLGRAKSQEHLRWDPDQLSAFGIDCVPSERGGDVTLHNPGQLVGYPIVDLKHYRNDLHRFLRQLEDVIIATLSEFHLEAQALPQKTGVWIDGRKIASIGIAVRKWISYHGFALNIQNDLSMFDAIVPCGLSGVQMTSMQKELTGPVATPTVAETLIRQYSYIMNRPLLGAFDDTQISSQT